MGQFLFHSRKHGRWSHILVARWIGFLFIAFKFFLHTIVTFNQKERKSFVMKGVSLHSALTYATYPCGSEADRKLKIALKAFLKIEQCPKVLRLESTVLNKIYQLQVNMKQKWTYVGYYLGWFQSKRSKRRRRQNCRDWFRHIWVCDRAI